MRIVVLFIESRKEVLMSYQPPPSQQLVKTYRTGFLGYADKKFAKDATKLAQQGWRVQSQSSIAGSPFGHPRAVTVTYVR